MAKIEEIKASKGKQQVIYKGAPIRLSAKKFCRPRENLQAKILYLARLSFRFYGDQKFYK